MSFVLALAGLSAASVKFGRNGALTTMDFRSSVPLSVPPRLRASAPLFVAVRDGALNLSKVQKVSLRAVGR
jgi:hypothetical protein